MPDYADDDYIFDTQWLAMKRAINGNGIVSGLEVTEQGTPNMTVAVPAGVFYQLGNRRVYAGGNVTITAAEANDRWDIIVGDAGGITYHKGTAGIIPKPDNLGAAEILVAMVYVATGTTAITNAMIHDFGFNSLQLEHASQHENGGVDEIDVTSLSGVLADNQPFAAHNNTKHTDRTRNYGVGIGDFDSLDADIRPPLLFKMINFEANYYFEWLTGDNSKKLLCSFVIPEDFVSGLQLYAIWTKEHTGTGNVQFSCSMDILRNGLGIPFGDTSNTPVPVPATIGVTTKSFLPMSPGLSYAPGDLVIVLVSRNGVHGWDTYGGTACFKGFVIKYTADM